MFHSRDSKEPRDNNNPVQGSQKSLLSLGTTGIPGTPKMLGTPGIKVSSLLSALVFHPWDSRDPKDNKIPVVPGDHRNPRDHKITADPDSLRDPRFPGLIIGTGNPLGTTGTPGMTSSITGIQRR